MEPLKIKKKKPAPVINFKKINKLRVKQNLLADRDEILQEGGFQKWQRTKRQTMIINKPKSMFIETHML